MCLCLLILRSSRLTFLVFHENISGYEEILLCLETGRVGDAKSIWPQKQIPFARIKPKIMTMILDDLYIRKSYVETLNRVIL